MLSRDETWQLGGYLLPEIPELSDAEWTELVERLTLHADCKMRKLYWRGVAAARGGKPAGAVAPADMAAEAITDLMDGQRTWNKEAEPDLLRFLMGVVDSKVNHLAEKVENERTRESRTGTVEVPTKQAGRGSPPPDVLLMERDAHQRLRSAMIEAIGKDEVASSVFECLEAEITKPSEISEMLGMKVTDVNNAQKRLRRIADKVCDKLGVAKA